MDSIALSGLVWNVMPLAEALDDACLASGNLLCATPQDETWLRLWMQHANARCIAVTAAHQGKCLFMLPLELVSKGPLTVARFPGGSHANENFAAVSASLANTNSAAFADAVGSAIRASGQSVDAVLLERQLMTLDGIRNPLVDERCGISPNVALSFSLLPNFAAVLAARNGAKKLKKMRQMHRRMEDRGGYRIFRAQTEAEVDSVLTHFFKLKGERLKSMGVADVFEPAEVKAFFKALFASALGKDNPRFELHALSVGNDIAAVTGCSVHGKRITAEFGGICSADRQLSPGDILYHTLIEDCCSRGFEVFDFGIGDEFYKRRWCDVETWHRDRLIGITLKGKLLVQALFAIARAKRTVKNNAVLFGLVKRLRKKTQAAELE